MSDQDDLLDAALDALALLNLIAMRHADEPESREYQEVALARRKLCLAVSRAKGCVIGGSLPDMRAAAEMLKVA